MMANSETILVEKIHEKNRSNDNVGYNFLGLNLKYAFVYYCI